MVRVSYVVLGAFLGALASYAYTVQTFGITAADWRYWHATGVTRQQAESPAMAEALRKAMFKKE